MNLVIREIDKKHVTIGWDPVASAEEYEVFWADADTPGMCYRKMEATKECAYTLKKSTHIPHYIYVEACKGGEVLKKSSLLKTPVHYKLNQQLEKLNRGLIAVKTDKGIYIS